MSQLSQTQVSSGRSRFPIENLMEYSHKDGDFISYKNYRFGRLVDKFLESNLPEGFFLDKQIKESLYIAVEGPIMIGKDLSGFKESEKVVKIRLKWIFSSKL